jgi:hypothetical protein
MVLLTLAPDGVQPGMRAGEVRAFLGAPTSVSRQILHGRYIEQWRYQKQGIWVDFDGSKGQELRVRNVNPPGTERRR